MNQKITDIAECAYCGSDCDREAVYLNESIYCCYGCATLSDVVASIKNAPTEVALKYKQYDLAESFDQLVDYQNDKIYRIGISLPAIHCSSCIELLEDLPSFLDGILRVNVNFEQRRCVVTAEKKVPLSVVAQLLDDIGYPPQISISQKQKEEEKSEERTNLLKLAVAGFCFGNIMLFSMPHYFGLEIVNDIFFTRLFSILSVVISIPVLLYSGREYLTSAYKALSAGKSHLNIPISIGILSLFGWSLYEIISQTGIGYLDSLAGLIFFLLIGKWFQHKVYDQVLYHRNIQDFIPLVVRKITEDDNVVWQRIDQLLKGDRIRIKNQEIIPVNGLLVAGNGLIDYSFITGESIPEKTNISEKVYAGGSQKSGEIEVQLIEQPSIDKLWETWNVKSEEKEFSAQWVNHISKYFTIAVVVIALVSGLYWMATDMSKAAFVFSSVLIVACPCALALSAPFTYGSILRVFSKNQFFLKASGAISVLSRVRHIVFDKTGTITEKNAVKIDFIGDRLTENDKRSIYSLATQSTHPLSQIIANKYHSSVALDISDFQETVGSGISGLIEGKEIKLGSSQWVENKNRSAKNTEVYISLDQKIVGHFQIHTAYRKGLKETLTQLGSRYNISLLSGDNDSEKSRLKELFGGFSRLKFKLNPSLKALEIRKIKEIESVAMIGDGLNDSSAIQEGDIGIAVTENLNGFYPGSDAVLLSESFGKLPSFMKLAQYSKTILKVSLVFSLLYNITGVIFAVVGLLTPIIAAILMPLSSISVVLLNTALVHIKSKQLKLIE